MDQAKSTADRRKVALRDARIVADHTRGLTFAIAEGALPGNEGAGYVLRRLLRRAVTRGRSKRGLGLDHAFLADLAGLVVERFGGHYRELPKHRDEILKVLVREEESFVQTFEAGLARLEDLLEGGTRSISGEDTFALHDTYGFPVELTQEIAAERGVAIDQAGFEKAMAAQRQRARAASKFEKTNESRAPWNEVTSGPDSEFLGYQALRADGVTLRRWRPAGEALEVVLDRTTLYAESGGQVADRGRIEAIGVVADVEHVYKEDDQVVHRVRLAHGDVATLISAGTRGGLKTTVSPGLRFPTMRHHTATHLLHAALRQVLGAHVRQAGSLVAPDRLRFDYTHFEAPSDEQVAQVDRVVAEWILRNREVSWEVMPIAQARALGAMALFGEKYGAEVRVVTVPGIEEAGIPTSRELCGGTHVRRTGDIGAFLLVSDTAIASGVRRIEALCGHEAMRFLKGRAAALEQAAAVFQVRPEAVAEQAEKLKGELEKLRRAQSDAQRGGLEAEMRRIADQAVAGARGRWIAAEVRSEAEVNAVRDAADALRSTLKRGAAVLALQGGGKLTFLAAVTDDLVAEKVLRADELVRKVAQVTGGSGGGKPHLALAGGKDASRLGDALNEARRLLSEALGGQA
jgi:alanyl-tRNA synthetase